MTSGSTVLMLLFSAIGLVALGWVLGREIRRRRNLDRKCSELAADLAASKTELGLLHQTSENALAREHALREELKKADADASKVRALQTETETKLQALQTRLDFCETALGTGDFGIWEWSPVDNTCTWDVRACRLFDAEKAPANYEDWMACIQRSELPALETHLRGALLGYGAIDIRTRSSGRSGSPRHLMLKGLVLRNDEGKPRRVIGLVSDVTDDIALREQFRLVGERLRLSLMGANDGMWEWRPSDDSFVVDERWLALSGCDSDSATLPRSVIEKCIHPEDLTLFRAALRAQRLKGAAMLDFECRVSRPSGDWSWLRWRGAITARDGEGEALSLCGTYSDVTERHRSEEALRRSSLLLRQVCQQMGIAALEIDAGNLTLQWTEELDLLHATPPDFEPSLEGLLGLYPQDARRELFRCIESSIEKLEPFDVEVRWMPPGAAAPLWYRWTGHPISSGGQVQAVCGLVQDVSSAREAANQRRELDGRLAELHQYEALSAATDDLAYDINSLLGSLLGFQELACDELPVGHKARNYVLEAMRTAGRTHDIIRQVLLLNRVRPSSRIGLRPHLIVEEVCDRLGSMLGDSIPMDRDIDRQCPLVQGDAAQLQQSFTNVACQAISTMMGKQGHLSVGLRSQQISLDAAAKLGLTMAGEFMVFGITVLAPGLNEQEWLALYTQASHDPGMQLSSSRKIISEHHGVLELTHDPLTGCRCEIWLPLLRTLQLHPPSSAPVPHGTGETVWIVDEERFVSRLAKLCLEGNGYSVRLHRNPEEMLTALKLEPSSCSVALIGNTLGDVEPPDYIRALRALKPGLPIIRIGAQASGSGCIGLEEPFTAADLARAVFDALHPAPDTVRILGSNSGYPFPGTNHPFPQ